MTPKCPKCGSVIYSRRNVLCGVCGERLPDELLFSVSDRARVEHDLEEIKKREQLAKVVAKEGVPKVSERWRHRHPILGAIIHFFDDGKGSV